MHNEKYTLENVNEYCENFSVEIERCLIDHGNLDEARAMNWNIPMTEKNSRMVIVGTNEGGYNCTKIDLFQLIDWIKTNKPEWIK